MEYRLAEGFDLRFVKANLQMTNLSDRDKTISGYVLIVLWLINLMIHAMRASSDILWVIPGFGACMLGVAQLADRNKSGFISSNPWLVALSTATMIFPGVYQLVKEGQASPLDVALGVMIGIVPIVLAFRIARTQPANSQSTLSQDE